MPNVGPNITVAVLDSGLPSVSHSYFLHLMQGYDFVSTSDQALDGDGRDSEWLDPGDGDVDKCPQSSWHGLQVSAVVHTIAPMSVIQPVRVLGVCKTGLASDVSDAVRWAAGGFIQGVPDNAAPAKIISMSFSGLGVCPSYLQSSVDFAVSTGAILIAAVGNNGGSAMDYFPSNCNGVIAVAASTMEGKLATYSNCGPACVAAPGSDITTLSLDTNGSAVMEVLSSGTSFSVVHLSGLLALLAVKGMPELVYLHAFECGRGLLSMGATNLTFNPSTYVSNDKSPSETKTDLAVVGDDVVFVCVAFASLRMFCANYFGPGYAAKTLQAYLGAADCQNKDPYFVHSCYSAVCPTSCASGMYLNGSCTDGVYDGVAATNKGQEVLTGWSVPVCTACTNVPANASYTGFGAGPTSNCAWGCNPGFFASNGSCSLCATGTYTNTSRVCTPCTNAPANASYIGYGLGPTSNCAWECNPGFFASNGSCSVCAAGTYMNTSGASVCLSCGMSTYSTTQGATSAATCQNCYVGTYTSMLGASSVGNCVLCTEAGQYVFQNSCLWCARGTYSEANQLIRLEHSCGASGTDACVASQSTTEDEWAASHAIDNDEWMASSTSAWDPDPWWRVDFGVQQLVQSARIVNYPDFTGVNMKFWMGNNSTYNGVGNVNCFTAPSVQLASVSFNCTGSARYFFAEQSDAHVYPFPYVTLMEVYVYGYTGPAATGCSACSAGSYSEPSRAYGCLKCEAGYYSNTSSSSACLPCGIGTYSSVQGATTCVACEAGNYSNKSGTSGCLKCEAGYYSNTSSSSTCLPCGIGTYSSVQGATTCVACEAGNYSNQSGASSCLKCEAGYYSNTSSSSACLPCGIGTYSSVQGATTCVACEAGKYSNKSAASDCLKCEAGATTCVACEAGKYSNKSAASDCLKCEAGYYFSTSFSSTCLTCVGNTYSSAQGATTCVACAVGTYTLSVASSSSSACISGRLGTFPITPIPTTTSSTTLQPTTTTTTPAPTTTSSTTPAPTTTSSTTLVPTTPVQSTLSLMRGSSATHTCVVGVSYSGRQNVSCWGQNVYGQLGIGNTVNMGQYPSQMGQGLISAEMPTGLYAVSCAGGIYHTCVLLSNGSVVCWGQNLGGQLGIGNTASIGDTPGEMGSNLVLVPMPSGLTVRAISCGGGFTCAILKNYSVVCWGSNSYGQLGNGRTSDVGTLPGQMGDSLLIVQLPSTKTVSAVSCGSTHACALTSSGEIYCWGDSSSGQLGIGSTLATSTPRPVLLNLTFLSVDCGTSHTCGILSNRSVICWGSNSDYQVGYYTRSGIGTTIAQMNALQVVKLPTGFQAAVVTCGYHHTCVLSTVGTVVCWGYNADGQLGIGSMDYQGTLTTQGDALKLVILPTNVTAVDVSSGNSHVCAILSRRRMACWGYNHQGQLGIGSLVYDVGTVPEELGDQMLMVDLPFSIFLSTDITTPVATTTSSTTPVPTSTSSTALVPISTSSTTSVQTTTSSTTPVPTTTSSTTPVPTLTSSTTPVPTSTSSTTPVPTSTSSTTPVPTSTSSTTPVPTSTSSTTPVPTTTSSTTPVPTPTSSTTKDSSTTTQLIPQTSGVSSNGSVVSAYQIRFVSTLAFSSPVDFSGDKKLLYQKAVVSIIAGLNSERDYGRVSLVITATARRRLLAGTVDAATTVSLDSASQVEAAAGSVNANSLGAALSGYNIVLLAMTPVETSGGLQRTSTSTAAPTTSTPQETNTSIPMSTPGPQGLDPMVVGLAVGGGLLFLIFLVCTVVYLGWYRKPSREDMGHEVVYNFPMPKIHSENVLV